MKPYFKIIFFYFLAMLFFPGFILGQAVHHTVKLISKNGVPQIHVDGQPIRPRMFFGYSSVSRSGSLLVGSEWKEASLQFTAPESDSKTAIHFRFGEDAGEIEFDDLRIRDLTEGKEIFFDDFEKKQALQEPWGFWCENKTGKVSFNFEAGSGKNGTTGLRVRLEKDSKLKGFHLLFSPFGIFEGHRYGISINVKSKTGRRLSIEVKRQGGDFRLYGGMPTPFGSQVRLAAESGVDWISFEVPTCWVEPGAAPNDSPALRACREVLQNNPNAMLIPRLSVNPPEWWRKANPSELVVFEDGEVSPHGSVASEKYRKEALEALRRIIRVLEQNFSANLAGYFPTGQNTGEWFYPKAWSDRLTGFETPMKNLWKESSGFELPGVKERQTTPQGVIRLPAGEKKVLAFARFQQELMADMILGLAKGIREETLGKRLTFFFYGYTFGSASYHSGPASMGHLALRKLLNSPDIDVLCAPIAYNDRGPGGAASCQSAPESIHLAGKLWLNEDDTRTDLAKSFPFGYPGWNSGAETRFETVEMLKRNLVQASVRNMASYWMDLGATGWFNEPELWTEMKRFREMDDYFLKNPSLYQPDIAQVVDEESLLHIAGGGLSKSSTRPLIYEGRTSASRSGATYGQYLLEEVTEGKVTPKIYFFLGTVAISSSHRQALKKVLTNASRVWCWAPGYVDGENFSGDAMKELSGFVLKKLDSGVLPKVISTTRGLGLGLPESFGPTNLVSPLFSPSVLESDEVLATFDNGLPAVVLRNLPNQKINVFCGTTELPASLYRALARRAGAHIYSDVDAHVWARGPYLGIHAVQSGVLEIKTASSGEVKNALTGESMGLGPIIKMPMRTGETMVLHARP